MIQRPRFINNISMVRQPPTISCIDDPTPAMDIQFRSKWGSIETTYSHIIMISGGIKLGRMREQLLLFYIVLPLLLLLNKLTTLYRTDQSLVYIDGDGRWLFDAAAAAVVEEE